MKFIFLFILSFMLFNQNCCEITSLDVLTKTYNIELHKPPNVTESEIDIYFGHQKDKHKDADGKFREKAVDFTKLKPKNGHALTEADLNRKIHFNKLLLGVGNSPDTEFGILPVLETVHYKEANGAIVIGYVMPRVDENLYQLKMHKFIPSWPELIKILETGFFTLEHIHLEGVNLKNIRLDNLAFGLKPHTNKLDIETDDNVLYYLKFEEFVPDKKQYAEAKGGKRVKIGSPDDDHSPAIDIHAYCSTMLEFFIGTFPADSRIMKFPPTKTKDIINNAKKDLGKDKVHEQHICSFFDGCFEIAAKLAKSKETPKEEWYDDLRSKLSKHTPLSKLEFAAKYEFQMDFYEEDAIASGQYAEVFAGSRRDNEKNVVFKKLGSVMYSDVTKEVYYNDLMSGENTHILPVLDTIHYVDDTGNIVNGYVQAQVDKDLDLSQSAIENKSPDWDDAKRIIHEVLNILEDIHLKFEIFHNDMKAENLAYGLEPDNKKLFLLDFGDAERYMIRGKPRKYEKHLRAETGTAAYQCVESLEGWTRGPIDDFHDLFMSMLVYSINLNKLPWDNKDDEDMCEMKRKLCTVEKIVNAIEKEVGVKCNFAEHKKEEIYTFFQKCFDFVKKKHEESRKSGVIQIPDKTWYDQIRGYLKTIT